MEMTRARREELPLPRWRPVLPRPISPRGEMPTAATVPYPAWTTSQIAVGEPSHELLAPVLTSVGFGDEMQILAKVLPTTATAAVIIREWPGAIDRFRRSTAGRKPSAVTCYAGGYGVGVENAILSAYVRSIAARMSLGAFPSSIMRITSRVTPRQIPQVGAIESRTTLPSAFTRST